MQTYYGKPIIYKGRRGTFTIQTAWESRGVLFHNPRVLLLHNERQIDVQPFSALRQVMDRATRLLLGFEPIPA